MTLNTLLGQILLLFGVGFLIANIRLGLELLRWTRRRRGALLVWPGPKPPFFALSLGIGVMLGLLILLKAYLALRGDPAISVWFRRFVSDTPHSLVTAAAFSSR